MILNDIFMLPSSRPDLEVCTKFGTPGVFAGPRGCKTKFTIFPLNTARPRRCVECNRAHQEYPCRHAWEATTLDRAPSKHPEPRAKPLSLEQTLERGANP